MTVSHVVDGDLVKPLIIYEYSIVSSSKTAQILFKGFDP